MTRQKQGYKTILVRLVIKSYLSQVSLTAISFTIIDLRLAKWLWRCPKKIIYFEAPDLPKESSAMLSNKVTVKLSTGLKLAALYLLRIFSSHSTP